MATVAMRPVTSIDLKVMMKDAVVVDGRSVSEVRNRRLASDGDGDEAVG